MPSKKKKYNARFPAGRIKKIMQTDEEVGKVAQAVPVIISRTLELFVESLIKKSMQITLKKNARTLSPHHMKLCILSESRFDFLRELVKGVPEVSNSDDDLSSVADVHSGPLSINERRPSMEAATAQQPGVDTSTAGSQLCFYKEIDGALQENRSAVSSNAAGTAEPPHTSSGCDFMDKCISDEDSDCQSSDSSSALVVSSIPDQNYSTSCDINEDYDT